MVIYGFFYEEWIAKQSSTRAWLKISAPAGTSGRVTESFLNGERKRKTAEQFANEFECAFASPHRNVFEEEWLERSFSAEIPLFDECSRSSLKPNSSNGSASAKQVVSHHEEDNYQGASVTRLQAILDALGVHLHVTVSA